MGDYLIAAREFSDFASRATLVGEPIVIRSNQFRRYLASTIGSRPTETVLAIFLDEANGFLATEILAMGSESAAEFPVRLLIARALEVGARGMVLAHNHPSGSAMPSEQDHVATEHIRGVTASLGINLLDHVIVARGQIFSMAKGASL
ncbi:JAB domain-containing protein [Erythrobacter litoralis]|uniref:JAB domain-containing protein n=1 Tax=Erythrobacter litoralis TaxID=39960 RepID=UPI002436031C|nr:JAB domain-containing protein [Erythrobacter litoralis]